MKLLGACYFVVLKQGLILQWKHCTNNKWLCASLRHVSRNIIGFSNKPVASPNVAALKQLVNNQWNVSIHR